MLCMNCGKDLGDSIGLCEECKKKRNEQEQNTRSDLEAYSDNPVSDQVPQPRVQQAQPILIGISTVILGITGIVAYLVLSGGSSHIDQVPPPSTSAIARIANTCRKKVKEEPELCDQIEVVCAMSSDHGKTLCKTFELKVNDYIQAGWSTLRHLPFSPLLK